MNRPTLVLAVVAMASAIVPTAAGAATDPVTKVRTGIVCEVQASPSGFAVAWDLNETTGVERVVIERKVSSTFHWRAKASPDQTSFVDEVAPRWVGSTDYRVIGKDAAGAVIESSDCDLIPTAGLGCVVTRSDDGYKVDIEAGWLTDQLEGGIDFVVRRNMSPDRPWFWRGRTAEANFDDASAAQAYLLYQVWARADGRIVGATTCRNELADPACVTPIDEQTAMSLRREIYSDGIGMEPLIDSLNALIPDQQIYFVVADTHDRIIYSRDHDGLADIYIYDPADGSNRLVGESLGEIGHTWGYYADIAGGVYVEVGEPRGQRYSYHRTDGTVQQLGSSAHGGSEYLPAGELNDGRTVFTLFAWPMEASAEEPTFQRIIVRAPGTDDYVALTELEGSRVRGVSLDGDLIVESGRVSRDRLFLYDADCIRS